MSAIARFFHQRGDRVSGYDRTESPITKQLVAEGIAVHYDDNPSLIPDDTDLVVYTPAVPVETAEYQHVLGGVAKNINSNVLVNSKSDYVVVEADEFDRSFLQLYPYCAVITATDADHLDVYGNRDNMLEAFRQFASQIDADGTLVLKEGLTLHRDDHSGEGEHDDHHHGHEIEGVSAHVVSYTARGIEADYYPWNVRNYNGNIFFDLRTPKGVLYDMELPNASLYNVENAVAAAAVCMTLGVNEYQLRNGLKTYTGVQRRFDYRIKTGNLVMIDDYAHHPQEIAACLESIRYLYPGKRVVGVFQPHLYSRTRDFANQFAGFSVALPFQISR